MEKFGVYIVNQNSNQMWELKPDQKNIIGRGLNQDRENTILLPHPTVSKTHAYIFIDPQTHRWYFENSSKNGSQVNSQVVTKKFPLQHGDQIEIGPHILIFYENFQADEETMEVSVLRDSSVSNFDQKTSFSVVEFAGVLIFFSFLLFIFFFIKNL